MPFIYHISFQMNLIKQEIISGMHMHYFGGNSI